MTVEIKFSVSPKPIKGSWTTLQDLHIDQAYVVAPMPRRYPLEKGVDALPMQALIGVCTVRLQGHAYRDLGRAVTGQKVAFLHLILYKIANMYKMRITMPAKSPFLGEVLAAQLAALGDRVRAQRERLKLKATATAEAAGMSRVTLHRIERGEPSVTMGAYLSAIAAVGLQMELTDPQAAQGKLAVASPPSRVRLADYPQLKRLAWQLHDVSELTPAEALNLYERNWRHIDQANMAPNERALVRALEVALGGGRLLV